jgi:hypothetical protein
MIKTSNLLYYIWGYLAVIIVTIHIFYKEIKLKARISTNK